MYGTKTVTRQGSHSNTGQHWGIYVECQQALKEAVTPHRYRTPAVPSSPGCAPRKGLQPQATLCAQKGTGQILGGIKEMHLTRRAPLYFLPAQPRLALRMRQVSAVTQTATTQDQPALQGSTELSRLVAMHDSTGFQEPLGRASLGQHNPHHTSRHKFPQALMTLRHPGKAMPASHFLPSGPLLHNGPWLTCPIWTLSSPAGSLPEPQRLGTTSAHLWEPDAFQSALVVFVIPKPLVYLWTFSAQLLLPALATPTSTPILRVHGTQTE